MKLKQKCPKCGGELTLAYRNFRKCSKCGRLVKKDRKRREIK